MTAPFDLDQGLAVLRKAPAVLRALLVGLPQEWTHSNEGPDSWSPHDIVGHLMHGEKTDWIPRAKDQFDVKKTVRALPSGPWFGTRLATRS